MKLFKARWPGREMTAQTENEHFTEPPQYKPLHLTEPPHHVTL